MSVCLSKTSLRKRWSIVKAIVCWWRCTAECKCCHSASGLGYTRKPQLHITFSSITLERVYMLGFICWPPNECPELQTMTVQSRNVLYPVKESLHTSNLDTFFVWRIDSWWQREMIHLSYFFPYKQTFVKHLWRCLTNRVSCLLDYCPISRVIQTFSQRQLFLTVEQCSVRLVEFRCITLNKL